AVMTMTGACGSGRCLYAWANAHAALQNAHKQWLRHAVGRHQHGSGDGSLLACYRAGPSPRPKSKETPILITHICNQCTTYEACMIDFDAQTWCSRCWKTAAERSTE